MQYEPRSSIFPSLMRKELSCTPAQVTTSAVGETDISPVVARKKRPASTPLVAPRLLSRTGSIDDESILDHVDSLHEETDDDFVNRLIDSESEDEDESNFGDNGYVDPTPQLRG